jgi:hypothetical protein
VTANQVDHGSLADRAAPFLRRIFRFAAEPDDIRE